MRHHNKRLLKDTCAGWLMAGLVIFSSVIVIAMAAGLYQKSRQILESKPVFDLIFSSSWQPMKGKFGFYPFIIGTLWVTAVAMFIAVPFSLLTAIYLSEYARQRVREWAKPLIDVLAGIPSVVYGVWGVLAVVPLIKDHIAPFFGIFSSGYSVLAGGIVLAIMILPVIIHVVLEVFRSVPHEVREASLALGATQWQTVKYVVVRRALPGIVAAIVLGVSRAFGETMAVLMVVGNVSRIPFSVFDPAYPLPALIANNYGEMLSIPLYDSALMFASFILFLIVLIFNIISRIILVRIEKNAQ